MAVAQQKEMGTGLSDILRGMWRRKWLVLALWLLGTVLGWGIVQISKPTYQTEAQVLIGVSESGLLPQGRNEPIRLNVVDERKVQSELAVLNSNDLAARVIEQLQLTKDPNYNARLRPVGSVKRLAIKLGFSDDPAKMTDEQAALRSYADSASIYQLPESNVIGIKYRAADPANAAAVANAIAETYVRSTQELQAEGTDETRDWLAQQIDDLRRKVSEAEANVERYRAEQGLLQGPNATFAVQEISELSSQITVAESAESEAKARAREIVDMLNTQGSVDASSDVLNSATIAALRERQLTAQQKISELSATYLDGHPKMIAAKRELRDVERQLRREALKVVEGLDGQAKIAASRAASLRTKMDQLKKQLGEANLSDVKLRELEREATANRTLLESMLNRYADANATDDIKVKPAAARIIQKAMVPSTIYFPKAGPLIVLLSLAGLVAGLGIAFLAEMMRAASRLAGFGSAQAGQEFVAREPVLAPPVRTSPDLRQPSANAGLPRNGVPTVAQPRPATPPSAAASPAPAAPPPAPFQTQEVAAPPGKDTATTAADTSAQLAAALLKLKDEYGIFASRFAGQTRFKTDVALFVVATARAVAAQRKKVLVIDADPTSHALEPLFDLEQGVGLSDLIEGKTDFTKIIRRDQQSTAHVISYGTSNTPETSAALEQRMESIIGNLADVYDVVLVHAGDRTPITAQSLLGCKSVIMIVPQNEQRDLQAAEQDLHDLGAESVMHVTLMQETILS